LFSESANQSVIANTKRRIDSLSHLLGYIGKVSRDDLELNPDYLSTDFIGKTGLEKYYEKVLRGKYGLREIEVDALGKEKNTVKESSPQSGRSLVLSLDLNYQEKLEEILSRNLKAQGKKRGSAIVMDPRNGEILALVTLPTFNNNLFAQGISNNDYQKLLIDPDAPLFDRAWSGTYPTGSVIKPVIAAAALNEGVITRWTTFSSVGGLRVDKWFFPDWKAGGHGLTDVTKALAESVNTFFFIVGGGYEKTTGLGLEKLISYFKKAGLGNSLGVDLPNEAAGFIPSREWKEDTKKERWYIGDTYNLSIGQGDLLATPLQVANYTAAIANGGTLYRPHLVQAIIDPVSGQKQKIVPQIIEKQLVPGNFLDIIKEGMRASVTYGSARSLADLPVQVAAKTGTAQWSKKLSTHAWFTSFAPYRDPQIVVTVLVEEGGEGSVAAAPVAREFYAWWSNHRNP
ncbi:MAG: penicillin-binding protein 2, partial [Patescibacteria group bacterium]